MHTRCKNPSSFDWTPQRDAVLKASRANGATYAEIASAFGTTEHAVNGRANRLGAGGPLAIVWTSDRIASLTKLWADGLSASQIAGRLGGVTRNAVIGKVHRLGLKRRATAVAADAVELPAKTETPRPENLMSKPAFAEPERPAASCAVVPPVEETPGPKFGGVELLDLKEHHCRWPMGEPGAPGFHFCGQHRTDGRPYCSKHARIAFQPVQRRRQISPMFRKAS